MSIINKARNILGPSLNKKVIRTTITLVDDEFKDGKNQIVVSGLRTSCAINYGNGSVMPSAEIVIYGLALKTMNKLLRIRWQDLNSMQNLVRIDAGDDGSELKPAFQGNITFAYIDTGSAPDIALRIQSVSAVYQAYRPAEPIAYSGSKSVVSAIREISGRMGYLFENSGVPESLSMNDVTLIDTDLNKIRRLCKAYQIDLYIDSGVISIAPEGEARSIRIPIITPKSGMIGYPAPTMQGVEVNCFYDPLIRFGGIIRIKDSIMETTNGDWRVFGATINIESEMPEGAWSMNLKAAHRGGNVTAISK